MTRPPAEETNWATKSVFSTGEAALVCRVSQQTIIRCFDSGRLQGFRVPGSKFRRIPRDELIRFMRANSIPVSAIEGSVCRVLSVHDGSLATLDEALSRAARVDLTVASGAFDAGWHIARSRPHLIVLDASMAGCSAALVRERLGPTRTVIVTVGPSRAGGGVGGVLVSGDGPAVRLDPSLSAEGVAARILEMTEVDGGH